MWRDFRRRCGFGTRSSTFLFSFFHHLCSFFLVLKVFVVQKLTFTNSWKTFCGCLWSSSLSACSNLAMDLCMRFLFLFFVCWGCRGDTQHYDWFPFFKRCPQHLIGQGNSRCVDVFLRRHQCLPTLEGTKYFELTLCMLHSIQLLRFSIALVWNLKR